MKQRAANLRHSKWGEFAGFYVRWTVYDLSQGKNSAQGVKLASRRLWLRYKTLTKIKLPLLPGRSQPLGHCARLWALLKRVEILVKNRKKKPVTP